MAETQVILVGDKVPDHVRATIADLQIAIVESAPAEDHTYLIRPTLPADIDPLIGIPKRHKQKGKGRHKSWRFK